MSVDGYGILASDLAHDVYTTVVGLLRSGNDEKTILQRLEGFESEIFEPVDEDSILGAALKAIWEFGVPVDRLRNRLLALLEDGEIRSRWGKAVSTALALRRESTLRALVKRTAEPCTRPKPRHAQPVVGKPSLLEVGECIELRIGERVFHCAVLAVLPRRRSWGYYLVPLRLAAPHSPATLARARYIGHMVGHFAAENGYIDGPHGSHVEQRVLLEPGVVFARLGRLPIDVDSFVQATTAGVGGNSQWLAEHLNRIEANLARNRTYSIRRLMIAA